MLGIVINDIRANFFHSSKYRETFLGGYVCVLCLSIITGMKYCIHTFFSYKNPASHPKGRLDYTENPPGSYGT